jgi:type IV secretory pathway VirB9-like protein
MHLQKTKLALALACAGYLSGAEPSMTSRTIPYHNTDIVLVNTELRFTTLVELPKEESIMEVTCGDKDYWSVNYSANHAYIKPAKQGGRTNFNLITTSGNVYSLMAAEVSATPGAHGELKLFLEPADESLVTAMKSKPKYVSAEMADSYKQKADEAQAQLAEQQAQFHKQVQRAEAEARASNSSTIRHDYKFSPESARTPFNISSIYHDDRFTYIEANPQEAFALYETKDGKPSLIQFSFEEQSHRYSIPKIVDDGYLRIGKKELRFHRENG